VHGAAVDGQARRWIYSIVYKMLLAMMYRPKYRSNIRKRCQLFLTELLMSWADFVPTHLFPSFITETYYNRTYFRVSLYCPSSFLCLSGHKAIGDLVWYSGRRCTLEVVHLMLPCRSGQSSSVQARAEFCHDRLIKFWIPSLLPFDQIVKDCCTSRFLRLCQPG
jgi:hypothetical protein